VQTKFLCLAEDSVFDSGTEPPKAPCEFTLDDGTATVVVTCSSRIRNRIDAELLNVGSTVTVIGKAQMQNDYRLVQCMGYNIIYPAQIVI
jgi:hypothetical protein